MDQGATTAATVESEGRNSSHNSRQAPRCWANSGVDRHRSTASLLSQLPNDTNCRGSSMWRIRTKPCAPDASRWAHDVNSVHRRTNSSSFPGFTIQLPDVNGCPTFVMASVSFIALPFLDWDAYQRPVLGPASVVVLDVPVSQELLQDEPGV